MKITFLLILYSITLSTALHGITYSAFTTLVQEYKAGKKEVTRADIIAAYATMKENVPLQLANQALRLLLNKNVAQLKAEEAQKRAQRKERAKARAQEEAKRKAQEIVLKKVLKDAQRKAQEAERKAVSLHKKMAAAQKKAFGKCGLFS